MEGSPVWKKPSDVMKIHRRRKSLSQKKVTASQEQRTDFIYKSPSKSVKRRNPFTSSENVSNKRHMANKEQIGTNEPMLFSILDSAEVRQIRVNIKGQIKGYNFIITDFGQILSYKRWKLIKFGTKMKKNI